MTCAGTIEVINSGHLSVRGTGFITDAVIPRNFLFFEFSLFYISKYRMYKKIVIRAVLHENLCLVSYNYKNQSASSVYCIFES